MRKPRQERFGREFHTALWARFRGLKPTIRRSVLATFAVLLLFAVAGGSPPVLYAAALIAACLVFVAHRHAPDDSWMPRTQELDAIDAQRELDDDAEYTASGRGHQAYEFVLRALLGLVGRDVTVIIGTGVIDRPKAMLSGVLGAGQDVARDGSYELLFFEVGATGNGFYVDRDQFLTGRSHADHSDDEGLALWDRDGVILIYENRAAVEHG